MTEYRYNGLGQRITWRYDTDADTDVDGSDKTYHFVYDDQWRIVGTYRDADANPKERFVYHAAGNDGYGGSSYIDSTLLRDRDKNSGWTSAGDGTLEERMYYCQNWRADVVAMIESSRSTPTQYVRYGEYGEAFGMPVADTEGMATWRCIDRCSGVIRTVPRPSSHSPSRSGLPTTMRA